MKFIIKTIIIFITLGFQVSQATVEMTIPQPDESAAIGKAIPALSFLDENNQSVTLNVLGRGNAFLLVPFYAHCKAACPLNIAHLKEVLKKSGTTSYRVILFSFNPKDTGSDLKDFRQALQVPKDWAIVRASAQDTNRVLETLDFRYMTQGQDFAHASMIAVLSPSLKITKLIQGLDYTSHTVDAAVTKAMANAESK